MSATPAIVVSSGDDSSSASSQSSHQAVAPAPAAAAARPPVYDFSDSSSSDESIVAPTIIGRYAHDRYPELLPFRVPRMRQARIEHKIEIVRPMEEVHQGNNWPYQPDSPLSFSSGGRSSMMIDDFPSPAPTAITQMAEDLDVTNRDHQEHMRGQQHTINQWRRTYKNLRRNRIHEHWADLRERSVALAQIWVNDVANEMEKRRLKREKWSMEALLRAEVQRLKDENEALVRRLKLAERKSKQGEKTAASRRSKRTCKSTYRRD